MSTFTPSLTQAASPKMKLQNFDESIARTYRQFGQGRYSYELACDLLNFRDESKTMKGVSPRFSAVFKNSDDLSESEFQQGLKTELSSLIHHSEVAGNWEPQVCADADRKTFCFTLDGTTFLVRGLHPYSSTLEQRAPYPTMVFEVFEDFHQQFEEGRYSPVFPNKNQQNAIGDLLMNLQMNETNFFGLSGH